MIMRKVKLPGDEEGYLHQFVSSQNGVVAIIEVWSTKRVVVMDYADVVFADYYNDDEESLGDAEEFANAMYERSRL